MGENLTLSGLGLVPLSRDCFNGTLQVKGAEEGKDNKLEGEIHIIEDNGRSQVVLIGNDILGLAEATLQLCSRAMECLF
jgi:hypothetical protein